MKSLSIRALTQKTLTVGLGRWLAQILNVLFLPLALAYVVPEEFGVFSLLQIASLMGGVLMSLGLYNAFIAQFRMSNGMTGNLLGRFLSQQIILGGIIFLLLVVFSGSVVTWLAIQQSTVLLVLLLFGEYFANLVLIINRWQILVNRHMQLSIVYFLRSIVQLVLMFVFVVWLHYGLLGLVIADFGSKVVAFLIAHWLSHESWHFEFRRIDLGTVIRLGLPAMPDPVFFWLLLFIPLYMLKSNGLLALAGAFSLGWRLMSPIELLGNSLASAAAGKMIDAETNLHDLNRWYRIGISTIIWTSLTMISFSPEIVAIFFDEEYGQIIPLLPYLTAGVMFLAFYYFEWVSVSGAGKTYGLSLASGGGLIVMLLGFTIMRGAADGLTATLLFALGFLGMWAIARSVNSRQRLGRWHHLVGGVILVIVLGLIVVAFPSSWFFLILKGLLLVSVALLLLGLEIRYQLTTREMQSFARLRFLTIPNYAEIAGKLTKSSTILDIGCSEGFFLGEVETSGLKVGIDTDFARLKIGRKERPYLNFVQADASSLPFRKSGFDTTVLIGVLPYVQEPVKVLQEVHRVLKVSGQIEISAASSNWFYQNLNVYNWKHRFHLYTASELENVFNAAGFKIRSMEERGHFITPLLGNLFVIPNFLDRLWANSQSVMGPCARWTRKVTNPIIQWEYDHHRGRGYQFFVSGIRHE
ncbi:MAG: methyltransferase domain-containing protein [Chloroflexota bacterium]